MPPVGLPELLEPPPEPETLEAGPEQRVDRHAEELIPECSPAGERRVPEHRLGEASAGIEEQAEQTEEDAPNAEHVRGSCIAGEPVQAHGPDQAAADDETANG